MQVLLFFLLLALRLYASEENVIQLEASVKYDQIFNKPENSFVQSAPDLFLPTVDPYSGQLSFECVDFSVAGIQPLTVCRRFIFGPQEQKTGYWDFNQRAHMGGNLEFQTTKQFLALSTNTGGIVSLKPINGAWTYEHKDYCNFGMSGHTHANNISLNYHTIVDPKNKERFLFQGTLCEGDGSVRYFSSGMHAWHHKITHRVRNTSLGGLAGSVHTYAYYPQVWIPYQLDVTQEKLANGNWLVYEHESWQEEDLYPRPSRIKKITAYNRDQSQILGWLEYHYSSSKMTIIGSDGRIAHYSFAKKGPPYLLTAKVPGKPLYEYGYDNNGNLCQIKREGQVVWKTSYDHQGRVVRQEKFGTLLAAYTYLSDHTVVTDALGNKILYYFDEQKRPTLTHYFEGSSLKAQKKQTWCPQTGNLLEESLLTPEGVCLHTKQWTYDSKGNVIEETLKNDQETIVTAREFSTDGFNLLLKEIDPIGRISTYTYLPQTNLCTSKTLSFNNKIIKKQTFTYDIAGVCIEAAEEDAGIKKITHTHPKQTLPCLGLPETIEYYDGQSVCFEYSSHGKALKKAHFDRAGSHAFTLENFYNDNEQLVAQTDAEGHLTQFVCDHLGRVTHIIDPTSEKELVYDHADHIAKITCSSLVLTLDYDSKGRLIAESDACGNITKYCYDMFDHPIKTLYPDSSATTCCYDPLGRLILSKDEEGYETHYSYNLLNQCTSCIKSDGTKEYWSYDACGRQIKHSLPTGALIETSYTALDQPTDIQVKDRAGSMLKQEKLVWEGSLLKEKYSPRGLVTSFCYNSNGQLIRQEQGDRWIEKSYDTLGRISCISNAEVKESIFYDNLNQVIRQESHNLSNELLTWKQYSYDAKGNKTQEKTFDGTWEYQYDFLSNLIFSKDPLDNMTHYQHSWDKQKQVTTISAKGIQTTLTYDCRDREIQKQVKDAQGACIYFEENTYDPRGNLLTQTLTAYENKKPKKTITHQWKYGPENLLIEFKEAGKNACLYHYENGLLASTVKSDGRQVQYAYDDLGRKTRIYGEGLDEIFLYDAEDNIVQVGKGKRVYNLYGELIQEDLANGLTVHNSYDILGRRLRTQYPNTSAIYYTYKDGKLSSIQKKDNIHRYLQRDLKGRVIQDSLCHFSWDPLNRLVAKQGPDYQYQQAKFDSHGNLLSYEENGQFFEYAYDDYDQLIQEPGHSYNYDSLNNRISHDEEILTYNASHQQSDLLYDLNGNLLAFNGWTFSYDLLDRLVLAQNATLKITYAYDGLGRCLSKTTTRKGSSTLERYLWDDQTDVGTYTDSGKNKELQVLGEHELPVFILICDNYYLPIQDFRGNLSTIIPVYTGLQQRYCYLAFYEQTSGGFSPWRFAGKRTDSHTGLTDFGNRFYVPSLGRWLTPDPLGFVDGPNPYAYVHNHPLTAWDYKGLYEKDPYPTDSEFSASLMAMQKLVGSTEAVDKVFPLDPTSFYVKEQEHHKLRFCYTNGINTTYESTVADARYLSNLIGNYAVAGLHNPTHGLDQDLRRCYLEVAYGITPKNIRGQQEFLRTHIEDLPEGGALVVICHSEGAIVNRAALKRLPESYRDKTHVIAVCPGLLIEKDLAKSVVNIRNSSFRRDIVPRLATLMLKKNSYYQIIDVDSHPDAPRFDHAFHSLSYKQRIIEQVDRLIRKYE